MTTWASGTFPIRTQLQKLVDDGTFESSGTLYDMLLPWTNAVISEICMELNIRAHLTSDTTGIVFDTGNHVQSLPTNFLKSHQRFTKVRVAEDYITQKYLEDLFAMDPDHDETTTNTYPDYCSIEGGYLYVYPMFAGTAYLDNYFRKPTDMSATTDVPDIPDDAIRTDMIVAGVAGKYMFPHLNEFELAKYYYDRSTDPPRGRFFEMLRLYDRNIGASASVRTDYTKFY